MVASNVSNTTQFSTGSSLFSEMAKPPFGVLVSTTSLFYSHVGIPAITFLLLLLERKIHRVVFTRAAVLLRASEDARIAA